VFGSRIIRTDLTLLGFQAGKFPGRIIGALVVVLLAGSSAFGQFLVQPMKMQIVGDAGRRRWEIVVFENLSKNVTETIDLRIVDVTQDSNGVWDDILPDETNVDRSGLRSCVSWLQLEKDVVEIGPVDRRPVRLRIEVPAGSRGYYFAAILARSAPRPDVIEGVTAMTILEYVIPVILEVRGRPMRHAVDLTDVGLEFRPPTTTRLGATLVSMDIKNEGGTYSRLAGMVRVWGRWGGHWRKVTEREFIDTGIIPGAKLHLLEDVGRPLPSGTYKIEGFLYVDAQRTAQLRKEVAFKGDPRVADINVDAPLDVDPVDLFVDGVPGAMRTGSVAVVNGSEETVQVVAEMVLPDHMNNAVSSKGVRGEMYGCTDWVTVEPARFTLRGYGRQNLRISVRMPGSPAGLPNYYGLIRLHSTYPDRQSAGMTRARVCVLDKKVQGTPQVDNMTFTVSELSPSRFMVTARFLNNGDVHVLPRCRAVLTTLDGATRKPLVLSSEGIGQSGIMLPLSVRSFSGVLDVADVAPGTYRLTAILEYDRVTGMERDERGLNVMKFERGGNFQDQIALEIVEQSTGKIVQVIDSTRVGGKTVIPL
jgi:hypothetical protein